MNIELPDSFMDDVESNISVPLTDESTEQNDFEQVSVEEPTNTIEQNDSTEQTESKDLIELYLQSKGVSDLSKLQYEDEDGELSEVDFKSLDTDEQLEILKELSSPGLSDSELSAVNYLRRNNVTLEQAINYFQKQAVDEYKSSLNTEEHYNIDDYNDDEIYVADLKAKFDNLSDEELLYKLEQAKENEDLFKKEVDVIRNSYKEQEREILEEAQRQEQERYENFKNELIDVTSNFNEIPLDYNDPKSDTLLVKNADKQAILSYLLDQDAEGNSRFDKDLANPAVLIELAWYRLNGKDAFSSANSYWKDQLKKARKEIKKSEKQSTAYTIIEPSDKKDESNQTIESLWTKHFK